jgi:(4S)-4-hydroxy-5-phosphonooxypentane-2,3-dione isomerase
MHIALVNVHVKPDAVAAFEAATEQNARQSRLEPGVARFDVLQQRDDPTRFVLLEVYRDAEAAVAHKTTAHYLAWRDAVATLMAEPRVGLIYVEASPDERGW